MCPVHSSLQAGDSGSVRAPASGWWLPGLCGILLLGCWHWPGHQHIHRHLHIMGLTGIPRWDFLTIAAWQCQGAGPVSTCIMPYVSASPIIMPSISIKLMLLMFSEHAMRCSIDQASLWLAVHSVSHHQQEAVHAAGDVRNLFLGRMFCRCETMTQQL